MEFDFPTLVRARVPLGWSRRSRHLSLMAEILRGGSESLPRTSSLIHSVCLDPRRTNRTESP